jgi:hypothetical protein
VSAVGCVQLGIRGSREEPPLIALS